MTTTQLYARTPVDPQELLKERFLYVGLSLSLTTYGLAVLLFLQTTYLLLTHRKHQQYHSRNTVIGLLSHLCITFSLLTTTTICNTYVKTRALIDFRDFPGGPIAYLKATYFCPPSAVAVITGIFVNYLTQGLMLYRCYVIFRDMIWFVVAPLVLFCSTIAFGLVLIWKVSHPMNTVYNNVRLTLPYFILTSAGSAIVTILITTRLLLHRRKLDNLYSESSCGKIHLGASAVVIESGALNTVFGLVSTVTYAAKTPVARLFLGPWTQIQFIASCLVVYRLAKKRAWTRGLADQFSSRSLNQLPVIHIETAT